MKANDCLKLSKKKKKDLKKKTWISALYTHTKKTVLGCSTLTSNLSNRDMKEMTHRFLRPLDLKLLNVNLVSSSVSIQLK